MKTIKIQIDRNSKIFDSYDEAILFLATESVNWKYSKTVIRGVKQLSNSKSSTLMSLRESKGMLFGE